MYVIGSGGRGISCDVSTRGHGGGTVQMRWIAGWGPNWRWNHRGVMQAGSGPEGLGHTDHEIKRVLRQKY
jgi:hypothetical protein